MANDHSPEIERAFEQDSQGRRTSDEPNLAERVTESNWILHTILFGNLALTTLSEHGFPNTLIKKWGQSILQGKIPEDFTSLAEMTEICVDVYYDPNKRFDRWGNRLWQE